MIRASQDAHSFETDHGIAEIVPYDILWAEEVSEGAGCFTRLHLSGSTVTCRNSLDALMPILGDTFLFCLLCGAVNQLRIRSFEENRIVLDNGESIAISPFLSEGFRQKYCDNLAHWVWED